jgi:Mor family transcriptional regulator
MKAPVTQSAEHYIKRIQQDTNTRYKKKIDKETVQKIINIFQHQLIKQIIKDKGTKPTIYTIHPEPEEYHRMIGRKFYYTISPI